MTDPKQSLDELIRHEKGAWGERGGPTDAGLARLHGEVSTPLRSSAHASMPYLVVGALIVLGFLGAREATRVRSGSHSTHRPLASVSVRGDVTPPSAPPTPPEVRVLSPVTSNPATAITSDAGGVPTETTAPRVRRDTAQGGGQRNGTQDALARELALLRDAQISLRRGDVGHALELAATHAREFPSGTLAPERRALERRAHCITDHRASGEPEDTCR